MKILARCENCKKRKLVIGHKSVKLPIGLFAKSQKQICKKCQKMVEEAINKNGTN